MKKMKNLLSLVLALVMVMAMTLTAMASEVGSPVPVKPGDPSGFTLTIDAAPGHTYAVYQIFTGDLARVPSAEEEEENDPILSDIQWGSSVNDTFKGEHPEGAAKYAETLTTPAAATELAETLYKKEHDKYVYLNDPVQTVSAEEDATDEALKLTVKGLSAGYYMVVDLNGASGTTGEDYYSNYILEVVDDTEVHPKGSAPQVEKKVQDVNDSTGETSGWQDSADYDIGDEVPFQLTATLPTGYSAYKTYTLIFHDVQSEGLKLVSDSPDSFVVKYGDQTINAVNYELKTTGLEDGCTFEIIINDLKKAVPGAMDGGKVTVEYKATVLESAVVGNPGNPNTVHLEYSNNPTVGGEGKTGTTPDDTVIVFTLDATVLKVDQDNKPLHGAEFALDKYDAETEQWVELTERTSSAKSAGEDSDIVDMFIFDGLDDGYYRLRETKTPAGYNSIDPFYFAVVATHTDENEATNDAITVLEVKQLGTDEEGNCTFGVQGDLSGFNTRVQQNETGNPAEGHLIDTQIKNQKGVTLPETGGIGTTIFTVSGIILVIIAGVLLVTKKRMSKEQ